MNSQLNLGLTKSTTNCLLMAEGLEWSLMDLRRDDVKVTLHEEKCGKVWTASVKVLVFFNS